MSDTPDDYEFGLVVAVAAGAHDPHLVDPAVVETIGAELRPVLTDLTAALSAILELWTAESQP